MAGGHTLLYVADGTVPPRIRRGLVGQPLLYAISVFISIGVFLVSITQSLFACGMLNGRISLAMTKGTLFNQPLTFFFHPAIHLPYRLRVMSGIITGPYFRNYFNNPNAIEVGTMVAVLEIGAFSAWSSPIFLSFSD